ncbi:antiterminator LoaP [Brevibacillus dissolubilis]|uniref:antiterminator LoaP n=1 Tax=Brevibacillus dissolubilis TaxID=1844116 RepID=UPI00111625ED|nr:antiterminator LoaP [Brevibacillus dissolubilis]
MEWYALYVKTGREEFTKEYIQKNLSDLHIRCLVPKRKVPEKRGGVTYHSFKLMFPGYVLVQLKIDYKKYHRLKEIPSLIKFLNYGSAKYVNPLEGDGDFDQSDYFAKIDSREMGPLLHLIDAEGLIDYSDVLIENSRVTILSGPLKDFEGIIKKIDKHKNRAKVELKFLDKVMSVDVGVHILYQSEAVAVK